METILNEIKEERARQDAKWGEQNHPVLSLGDNQEIRNHREMSRKGRVEYLSKQVPSRLSFYDIIMEELEEMNATTNPADTRMELIQVGACVVAAIEALDRARSSSEEAKP